MLRLLLALLTACAAVRGETLSSADREALLEQLERIRESVDSRISERFRAAIAAYQTAAASNEAAKEFYLRCVEKVDFEDQHKKSSEFREWKKREGDRLSDPGAGPALRMQLQWLILTLRASSERANAASLAESAREVLDAIYADAARFKGQQQILNQPVTATVFARAYEITEVQVERWPLAPAMIGPIYEEILLPPLRHPDRLDQLRAAWLKRIQQEIARQEYWRSGDSGRKIGTADALRPPEYQKFLEEQVPALQWQMETDLFKAGDESGSALRMLAHLEKHITHASSREWADAFRGLIAPLPETSAPPAG